MNLNTVKIELISLSNRNRKQIVSVRLVFTCDSYCRGVILDEVNVDAQFKKGDYITFNPKDIIQ